MATRNVLHVITGLGTGGAERMLQKICWGLRELGVESEIISLSRSGPIGIELIRNNFNVINLDIRNPLNWKASLKLTNHLKSKPEIVQGWMYHGNLAATILSRTLFRQAPCLWNIRQSLETFDLEKPLTKKIILSLPKLSTRCQKIIYNSRVSLLDHVEIGFPEEKSVIIDNGFDTNTFKPDQNICREMRAQLGIPNEARVILNVSRFHPQKDHYTLLAAAQKFLKEHKNYFLVLVGKDLTSQNIELNQLIPAEIKPRVRLIGEVKKPLPYYQMSDIYTSSSLAESFSNSIGEAMSCELACVASRVGNAEDLLLETSQFLVNKKKPQQIINAWEQLNALSQEEFRSLKEKLRSVIIKRFSIQKVTQDYLDLYNSLVRTD